MAGFGAILGGLKGILSLFGGGGSTSEFSYEKDQWSQQYSDELLGKFEALMGSGLDSGQFEKGQEAIGGRLDQIIAASNQPEFNVEDFTKGITSQATAATKAGLESSVNGILSSTGASEGGSSMAALLAGRMRQDAADNLAGITSQARATGEGIKRAEQESLTTQIGNLGGTLSQQILALLNTGKGAYAKGHAEGKGTSDTSGKGIFG